MKTENILIILVMAGLLFFLVKHAEENKTPQQILDQSKDDLIHKYLIATGLPDEGQEQEEEMLDEMSNEEIYRYAIKSGIKKYQLL